MWFGYSKACQVMDLSFTAHNYRTCFSFELQRDLYELAVWVWWYVMVIRNLILDI